MIRFTIADIEQAHRDLAALWQCFTMAALYLGDSLDDAGLSVAAWEQRGTALDEARTKARAIWDRYPGVLWFDCDRNEPLSVVDRWQLAEEEWSAS